MKLGMLIITLLCAVVSAAAEIPSALDVVSRMTETSVRAIVASVPAKSTITLAVTDHPDAQWVESTVLREFTSAGYTIVTTSAPIDVRIVIKDLSTQYHLAASSDSVERKITVALEAIVTSGTERRLVAPDVQRDSVQCTRADAKEAESMQHTATHAELPVAPTSMWDDIVEPVIFVTAAVATVVLLFTVRSK